MNFGLVSSTINKALPSLSRTMHRQKLVLRKNSPHILFGIGLVGSVTGTVLACRATLRLSETMDEIEHDVSNVREARRALLEEGDKPGEYDYYSIKDVNRDTALIYVKAAAKLGKLYGPSILVSSLSIGALTGSHITLTRRNTSLAAAYAAMQKAYDDYRERVIAELGPEREAEIKNAVIKYTDENGDEIAIANNGQWSPYARFFDSCSENWQKNAELNRNFLICQQNWANDMLRARGHLFLNEVHDMLGLERTPAGQVVGWVIGGDGDDYVTFNLDAAINERFLNGIERNVLLDFNVDGVVFELI